MDATSLYNKLEKDFITMEMSDDWADHMGSVSDFLSENFKQRSMGLVCDFANEIDKVYTAVFPSKKVMQKILDDKNENALLFVHHPSIWDIRKAPEVFGQMDRNQLEQFKERKIAIYNLHVPMDNYGNYSTSNTLAKALGIVPKKAFAPYFGALAGTIGTTKVQTVQELREIFQKALGHEASLYAYGDGLILNKTVAIVAGGGLTETIEEVATEGVNVFVTGITALSKHSEKAHAFAKAHRISLLGGTHYSTEKFACKALVDYFKKTGLEAKFIEDEPVMEDL